MRDTIEQIVEMDRRARSITEAAQTEKLNSEHEIALRCEELRRSYLEKARHRIAVNEPEERAAAEADWKRKEQRLLKLGKELDEQYAECADKWVDEILLRVLGQDENE